MSSNRPDFRTVLDDLTTRPAPLNLADLALATAARRRRRDRILTVAGAAVLVVAVAVPVTLVRHGGSKPTPTPAGSATPTPRPTRVLTGGDGPVIQSPIALCKPSDPGTPQRPAPGKQAVLSYEMHTNDPRDPWYAWDPQTHKYIRSAGNVRPSPDGTLGLISDGRMVGNKFLDGFDIAAWSDAIHERNLHRFPDKGTATWAPDGTVVAVNNLTHTMTYVNPATMGSRTIPWPPALVQTGEVVVGFGAITNQQLVLWSVNNRDGRSAVYVRVLDQTGKIVRTTAVGVAEEPTYDVDLATPGEPALLEQTTAPTAVSPDGRYIAEGGMILDTAACRSTTGPITTDGFYAGWYGGDLVLKTTRGDQHKPIALTAMDANGKFAFGTPLTDLPGYGNGQGITKVYVAAVGPTTQGAVTI
jgi:hypothetical protein